ncbi:hypothetical protein PoB_000307100 [Plakobranchus ocellatus]|uniref:Uncharacterized protein n=1 Tax=Plakobranchus ocellatus TaxID=259542 RepID=A0AAV3XG34_9GAST|nr:hypothetical protein PoB_000307100 [Plakobranchus ocellatus]
MAIQIARQLCGQSRAMPYKPLDIRGLQLSVAKSLVLANELPQHSVCSSGRLALKTRNTRGCASRPARALHQIWTHPKTLQLESETRTWSSIGSSQIHLESNFKNMELHR